METEEPPDVQKADRLQRDIRKLIHASTLPLPYKRGVLNVLASEMGVQERREKAEARQREKRERERNSALSGDRKR